MITFKNISDIFTNALENPAIEYKGSLEQLLHSCISVNLDLWKLEDIARMKELGAEKIAAAKVDIDRTNQKRNDLITKMDEEIQNVYNNDTDLPKQKYIAESPGMLIDRISILFIKQSMINKITAMIKDDALKSEYSEKQNEMARQINYASSFLDLYLQKIKTHEAFFKIHKSVKIYNDERVKNYIKSLTEVK